MLEARRQGILPFNVSRREAYGQAQRYQEDILNMTEADLPRTCLSDEQLDELRDISYRVEQQYMPSMLETHNESFVGANQKGKFCSADATKVLQDPGWRSFLGSILSNQ